MTQEQLQNQIRFESGIFAQFQAAALGALLASDGPSENIGKEAYDWAIDAMDRWDQFKENTTEMLENKMKESEN